MRENIDQLLIIFIESYWEIEEQYWEINWYTVSKFSVKCVKETLNKHAYSLPGTAVCKVFVVIVKLYIPRSMLITMNGWKYIPYCVAKIRFSASM